jgi:hypothetical protein
MSCINMIDTSIHVIDTWLTRQYTCLTRQYIGQIPVWYDSDTGEISERDESDSGERPVQFSYDMVSSISDTSEELIGSTGEMPSDPCQRDNNQW